MPDDVASQQPGIALSCRRLAQKLHYAGLNALLIDTEHGATAGGLAAAIDLERHSESEIDSILCECKRHLEAGIPVNIAIGRLGGGESAVAKLGEVCERIAASLDEQALSTGLLGTCLYSHQVPLKAYEFMHTTLLGSGPAYALLDSLQMRHHANSRVQQETDNNWLHLWRRRGSEGPLLPAYAAPAKTACPLLADEVSSAVLPACGVPVPAYSAWLPIELYLPNYADGRGELQWPPLQQALAICLRFGNELLDRLSWPTELQRNDARQNRRLAIRVDGIGDLVAQRGADPRDLETLRQICSELSRLRTALWMLCGKLAVSSGPLPALLGCDPTAPWHDPRHRRHWQARWQTALRETAVRNRNLLALSPYSVLPADRSNAMRYADLLPVLEYADVLSFSDAPGFDGWTAPQYRRFHERAFATVQRQNGTSFIAAGA